MGTSVPDAELRTDGRMKGSESATQAPPGLEGPFGSSGDLSDAPCLPQNLRKGQLSLKRPLSAQGGRSPRAILVDLAPR